jgi:hypothetical protein
MGKWPSMITKDMGLFALQYAINFHNSSTCKDQEATPFQLYTGEDSPWSLFNYQVFGCPTYILDKTREDGNKLNKWKQRAWQGIYVNYFICHVSSIPLTYNPKNTHVTPQFHVIF